MERVNIRQRVGALALVGLLAGAGTALAQQGTVTGRVTDSTSRQAVVSAKVFVGGTTQRTLTDQQGRFRFENLSPGSVTIRVEYIGYKPTTKTITVQGGETATLDFALLFAPIGLDAVVVTATGQEMQRQQPNAIHRADAADITSKAAPTDMADLLNAKIPGVTVQDAGGTTGSGTRIRIRGSNSLSLSNDPVVYLDGVRVEAGSASSSVGVGGQTPSRINDINPNDLESVQVAGGPSANVLFGTDAANGVIQFRTKQGKPGPTRWDVYAEGGTLNDVTTYPANYRGVTATGATCTLVASVRVSPPPCVQTNLLSFNPLEVNSPFRTGSRAEYGVAASGGTEQTTYYLSTHWNSEMGVYQVNSQRQFSLLANIHEQASSRFDFSTRAGYTSGKLRLPENDNNSFGVVSSGFLGRADTINQGYGFLTPAQSFSIQTYQIVDRFIGGFQGNFRAADWLSVHAVTGVDFLSRQDTKTLTPGAIPAGFSGTANAGSRSSNPFQIYTWTGNVDAEASFVLTPTMTSNTSAGVQYFKSVFHGVSGFVQNLTAGTGSLAGGVIPSVTETTQPVATLGKFVDEKIGINNRLFFDGALRQDQNSTFGVKFGNILYPKLGTSWVISEEPFFPQIKALNTLRLRASWGRSGVHPGPTDALQFYNATPVVVGGTDVTGITIGNLGNQSLKPERTTEAEVGFEADGFSQVAHIDFAYYAKSSSDALIARVLAPSLGVSTTQFLNLGKVTNKGVEISASARALSRPTLGINITATAWGNRNRLVTLGQGISPIIFGLGGASQRHTPGYALGSYFMVPYTYKDVNGDGIIDLSEVTLGAAPTFQGQPFPDHGATLALDVTVRQHVRLYALLDGRFGNKLFNSTEQFRCGFANCRAINDKTASLADQAAAVANLKGTQAGFIQDGGFTKLREISVTYFAPDAWAKAFGASALAFSFAGRNLATWTKYRGVDPELNEAGQNNFTTADFLTQPPVRYFIGRVNVTF